MCAWMTQPVCVPLSRLREEGRVKFPRQPAYVLDYTPQGVFPLERLLAVPVAQPELPEPAALDSALMAKLTLALTLPDSYRALHHMSTAELVQIARGERLRTVGPRDELIRRIREFDERVSTEVLKEYVDLSAVHLQSKGLVLAAVSKHGIELKYAAEAFKADPDVVWAAVRQNSKAYAYAAARFRDDVDLVLTALRIDGNCLRDAPAFQAVEEVVLAAVSKNPEAIQYATSPSLAVIRAVVSQPGFGNWIKYGGSLDPEMAALAVTHSSDGLAASYLPLAVRERVRGAALRSNGNALQFYSRDLESVLTAVQNDGLALQHAGVAFQGDLSVVCAAVAQNPWAVKYASRAMQGHPKVAILAAAGSGVAFVKCTQNNLAAVCRDATRKARAFSKPALRAFVQGASAWTGKSDAGPARKLSHHGPHHFKMLADRIAGFLGDEAEFRVLAAGVHNLRYIGRGVVSPGELENMRANRRELEGQFHMICSEAGSEALGLEERAQLMLYLASAIDPIAAHAVAVRHLRAGKVPQLARF